MARPKSLTTADLKLWAAYSQTLNRLMPGRSTIALPAEPIAAPEPAPSKPLEKPMPSPRPGAVHINIVPAGIDRATWKRFSGGRIRAAARLDLHGMTAARAHQAVHDFIEQAYAAQTRCVEIITGKGEILAYELPFWLNAPNLRPYILALAHPHAANTGSVRLLLRRIR